MDDIAPMVLFYVIMFAFLCLTGWVMMLVIEAVGFVRMLFLSRKVRKGAVTDDEREF